MTQNIKDKVVVITGASSGLGEAAARQLARQGAKLVLGARRIERLQGSPKSFHWEGRRHSDRRNTIHAGEESCGPYRK